ncbi:MAG: DUF4097 family beta strand repeat-containing protein, partial [Wenzhouxiangellaceae bacterium]
RELELTISPGSRLVVDAGAGSLVLQGDPGADRIHVTAEIYQVEPSDNYTLTLEADGDETTRLVSEIDSRFGVNKDRIDLEIRVPNTLEVKLTDGSGSIKVTDIAGPLTIEDRSGSISIENVGADVMIDDGSGSIQVENVAGNLTIEDGSGSITVRGAGGDVTIDDGSGSIDVNDTGGVVTVSDGSGSINVDGAADFELLSDGSGSVNVSNLRDG